MLTDFCGNISSVMCLNRFCRQSKSYYKPRYHMIGLASCDSALSVTDHHAMWKVKCVTQAVGPFDRRRQGSSKKWQKMKRETPRRFRKWFMSRITRITLQTSGTGCKVGLFLGGLKSDRVQVGWKHASYPLLYSVSEAFREVTPANIVH